MYYLLSRTWLFGCAVTGQTGNPRVQKLLPTQAVNSHSKVSSSKDIEGKIIFIWKLHFDLFHVKIARVVNTSPSPTSRIFQGNM